MSVNGPGALPIPVARVIEHMDFMLPDVVALPNGNRKASVLLPNGDLLVFTMNEKSARKFGSQLMAPSLALADQLPDNGNGAGG